MLELKAGENIKRVYIRNYLVQARKLHLDAELTFLHHYYEYLVLLSWLYERYSHTVLLYVLRTICILGFLNAVLRRPRFFSRTLGCGARKRAFGT